MVCYDATLEEQLLLGEGPVEATVNAPSNSTTSGGSANEGSAGNDEGCDFCVGSRVLGEREFAFHDCFKYTSSLLRIKSFSLSISA